VSDEHESRTTTSGTERVGYRRAEQYAPPEPTRASDVAVTTFDHVFEVDSRLMERWVLQQEFPNWDSLRIMNSRHDHLDWMHRHFADHVVNGSMLLAELESENGADKADAGDQSGDPTTSW
jgi:hypothetical protein